MFIFQMTNAEIQVQLENPRLAVGAVLLAGMGLQVLQGLEGALGVAGVAIVGQCWVLQGADHAVPAPALLPLLLLHPLLLLLPLEEVPGLGGGQHDRLNNVPDGGQAGAATGQAGRLLEVRGVRLNCPLDVRGSG